LKLCLQSYNPLPYRLSLMYCPREWGLFVSSQAGDLPCLDVPAAEGGVAADKFNDLYDRLVLFHGRGFLYCVS